MHRHHRAGAGQAIRFAPDLVEQLLTDLTMPDGEIAPPHIQLVCTALYDAWSEQRSNELGSPGVISAGLYMAEGGVQGILADHLNRVLTRNLRTQAERALARRLLVELVSAEQRRVRCRRSELAAALTASNLGRDIGLDNLTSVLDQLVENRLLVVEKDENSDEAAYELVHDYLLDEIKVDPQVQARKAAQELLAQEVKTFQRFGTRLSPEQFAIIDSQRNVLVVDTAAAELLRLSQTQLENEQRRQLLAARRLLRWTVTAAITGLAALVLAVVSGLSAQQAQQSEHDHKVAEARRGAIQAYQELAIDPVQSINLSLAVLRGAYVPEAEFALTQALHTSLERRYLSVSTLQLTQDRVALGKKWIAVGGDGVWMVPYDLSQPVTLAAKLELAQQVQWDSQGETLLSRDDYTVRIWQAGKLRAQSDLFKDVVLCAEWRPAYQEVMICSGRDPLALVISRATPRKVI